MGARRTTPVLSLQVESYIPPWQLRFQLLLINWALRYMYLPVGDQVAYTFGFLDQEILLDTPFIVQARHSFQKLNLPPLQRVPTPLMSTFPPHVEFSSSIFVDMLSSAVNSMPPEHAQNCFQDFWKLYYPQQLQIYTDESRSATGLAFSGLYMPSKNLATGWLLNPVHTVLEAEYAIYNEGSLPWSGTLCPRAGLCPGVGLSALEWDSLPWSGTLCPGVGLSALEWDSLSWSGTLCPRVGLSALEWDSLPWSGTLLWCGALCLGVGPSVLAWDFPPRCGLHFGGPIL
jgi:hypothetical protein